MELHTVKDKGIFGVKVDWSRARYGMTLWDKSGNWEGMPERIESAVYDGLSKDDVNRLKSDPPDVFKSPELAIAWGVEQGAFDAVLNAKKVYAEIKKINKPKNAKEMNPFWVGEVKKRLG